MADYDEMKTYYLFIGFGSAYWNVNWRVKYEPSDHVIESFKFLFMLMYIFLNKLIEKRFRLNRKDYR